MEDRIERQLKKGALELIVLRLLAERPGYGYELLTELARRSGGVFALREGTLYPILYRLEDDGLLKAGWSAGEGRGAPKKTYEITDAGHDALARGQALWREFSAAVSGLLLGEEEEG